MYIPIVFYIMIRYSDLVLFLYKHQYIPPIYKLVYHLYQYWELLKPSFLMKC